MVDLGRVYGELGFDSRRTRNDRKKLDGGRIVAGQHVSGSAPGPETQGRVVVVAGHDPASPAQTQRHAQAKEGFETNGRLVSDQCSCAVTRSALD